MLNVTLLVAIYAECHLILLLWIQLNDTQHDQENNVTISINVPHHLNTQDLVSLC
jgi:hypothetical protein